MPQAPARLSGSQALDTPFPSADAQLRRDLAQGGYTPHGTAEGAYDAYDAAPQAPPWCQRPKPPPTFTERER